MKVTVRTTSGLQDLSIGFSGTRLGMTMRQHARVADTFREVFHHQRYRARLLTRLRHGLCVGADAEIHAIARATETSGCELYVIGMPGPPSEWSCDSSIVNDCDEVRPVMAHMRRNRAIVDESHIMIAAPSMSQRAIDELEAFPQTGGTFRTIGMARHAGLPLAIVFSCGTEWRERWPR